MWLQLVYVIAMNIRKFSSYANYCVIIVPHACMLCVLYVHFMDAHFESLYVASFIRLFALRCVMVVTCDIGTC